VPAAASCTAWVGIQTARRAAVPARFLYEGRYSVRFSQRFCNSVQETYGSVGRRQLEVFLGSSMGTTLGCFHAGGEFCLCGTALNTFVRKQMARLGRYLSTLFGIMFGLGALPNLSTLMTCRTSEGVVNVGSLPARTHMP
jgi:hypothetical protein